MRREGACALTSGRSPGLTCRPGWRLHRCLDCWFHRDLERGETRTRGPRPPPKGGQGGTRLPAHPQPVALPQGLCTSEAPGHRTRLWGATALGKAGKASL